MKRRESTKNRAGAPVLLAKKTLNAPFLMAVVVRDKAAADYCQLLKTKNALFRKKFLANKSKA
jgi:hypothetical protein